MPPGCHVVNAALGKPKDCVVPELDECQKPAIRLESIQCEYELLEIPIDEIEDEDTQTASQELSSFTETTNVEAEDLQSGLILLRGLLGVQSALIRNIETVPTADVNRIVGSTVIRHIKDVLLHYSIRSPLVYRTLIWPRNNFWKPTTRFLSECVCYYSTADRTTTICIAREWGI